MTELKQVTVEEWAKALRSGKYKQTKSRLKTDEGFCCLGVLCDLQGVEWKPCEFSTDVQEYAYNYWYAFPANKELMAVGFTATQATELADMNDEGKSFDYIADQIEIMAKEQADANS